MTPPGSLSLPLGWAPPDAHGVPEGCGKAAERWLGFGGGDANGDGDSLTHTQPAPAPPALPEQGLGWGAN